MTYIFPALLLILASMLLAVKIADWRRNRKLKMGGWYFEFISPNMLRGESGEYAFVYRTAKNDVWFVGVEGERPLSPCFTDVGRDSRLYYEEHKQEIHARLRTELARWPRCHFSAEDLEE